MATADPPLEDHPLVLLSGATPQDLSSHPSLASLLRRLTTLLGSEGQSRRLERDLRRAEAAFQLRRAAWLRCESLWRAIHEVMRDPRRLEPTVLRALERTITSALPPPLPPLQDPSSLLARLLPALERRLGEKVSELVDYHGGGLTLPDPSDLPSAPSAPSLALVAALKEEKRRLKSAKERERSLREVLGAQRRACLQALWGALMGAGGARGCAGARAALDERRSEYLCARGAATLLRTRLEELSVLVDTYPGPKLEAHRHIRASLEASLSSSRRRLSELRASLEALRALGPSFAAAAAEYGRLRERLAQRTWALQHLRAAPHGH